MDTTPSGSQAQMPTRRRICQEQVGAQPVALAPTRQKATNPGKAPISPTEMARRVEEAERKRQAEAPVSNRQVTMRQNEFQSATNTGGGATTQEQLETSQRERQASMYTDLLINGKPGVWGGLMRERNMAGDDNLPFDHQRIAVKRFIHPDVRFMVLGHDMGLGKTATAQQTVAAMSLVYRRIPKTVIVVPSAVREQWLDCIFDWLRVPRNRVFSTSCLADVTPAKLKKIDMLIITRDCVSNAFGSCFSRQERIKETAHGNRKVMEWLRTPGKPMLPLQPAERRGAGLEGLLGPRLLRRGPLLPQRRVSLVRVGQRALAALLQAHASERHLRGQQAGRPRRAVQGGRRAARRAGPRGPCRSAGQEGVGGGPQLPDDQPPDGQDPAQVH